VKLLVTGASGFVGSHAVAALLSHGHRVRALVRDARKLESVLAVRGIELDDYALGDIADADSVRGALRGCDAVIHAAATPYGVDGNFAASVRGARNVLGIASELGLDPIVHVSSIAVLLPPARERIAVDDPIRGFGGAYARAKAEAERFARELQARGAPLVVIYPAGVFGPGDPGPGESSKGLRDGLRFGWPITAGGVSIVDVRDLAEIAAAAAEPGLGPRRFMAGGRFASWSELADHCDAITGRRTPRYPLPAALLRGGARVLDAARRIVHFDYAITRESAEIMTRCVPCDSSATLAALGVQFRPTAETLADTIRSLYESGRLDAKLAGKLAAERASASAA
jgi:nucleoside-diphosphate-sugar epimerase